MESHEGFGELESMAEALITEAEAKLMQNEATRLRIQAFRKIELPNEFELHLDALFDSAMAGQQRLYVHRQQAESDTYAPPVMFAGIQDLTKGRYRGHINQPIGLGELLDGVEVETPMHELLETSFHCAQQQDVLHDIGIARVSRVLSFFSLLMEDAHSVEDRSKIWRLTDDSRVEISSRRFQGARHPMYKLTDSMNPPLGIGRSYDETRYQLERTEAGALESYIRPSSIIECMARYCRPEDVDRDGETGEVLGMSGNLIEQEIQIEAERASGDRALRRNILVQIEDALGLIEAGQYLED